MGSTVVLSELSMFDTVHIYALLLCAVGLVKGSFDQNPKPSTLHVPMGPFGRV